MTLVSARKQWKRVGGPEEWLGHEVIETESLKHDQDPYEIARVPDDRDQSLRDPSIRHLSYSKTQSETYLHFLIERWWCLIGLILQVSVEFFAR